MSRFSARKIWIAVASCTVVLIAGAYIGSPYWAARALKEAVLQGDADKIDEATDMPAIREGLKSQISAAMMRKMNADPEANNSPFAKLGALLAPAIIDKAIDTYITPDGLVTMLKGGNPLSKDAKGKVLSPKITYDSEYLSLDRFRVKLRDLQTGTNGPSLLFERRGIFTWKLIRIELPDRLFKDLAASPSDSPPPSPQTMQPEDRKAAAYKAAFDPTGALEPVALVPVGDSLAVIAVAEVQNPSHADAGTLAVQYVKRDGDRFVRVGQQLAEQAGTFGRIGEWTLRRDLGPNPMIALTGGGTWQGCTMEGTTLIELTANAPHTIATFIPTDYQDDSGLGTGKSYSGKLTQSKVSIKVAYTGNIINKTITLTRDEKGNLKPDSAFPEGC